MNIYTVICAVVYRRQATIFHCKHHLYSLQMNTVFIAIFIMLLQINVMSMHVCLFVHLSVCLSQKPHGLKFTEFLCTLPVGRCDMLCTSGFVDDVMFSHNGLYAASCAHAFLSSESVTAKTIASIPILTVLPK